jgi:glycosyltransferase involved in cell wall biosynthesis
VKVLHVTPWFYPAHRYGGPIQSQLHLCRALAAAGCDLRVLTINANGPEPLGLDGSRDLPLEGFSVRYCNRGFSASGSLQMLRLLPQYVRWADVVHLTAVYSFPTMPTLAASRWYGKPLVWSPRAALMRYSDSARPQLKSIWEAACKVIAPKRLAIHVTSEDEQRMTAQRVKWPVTLIPNAIYIPPEVNRPPRADTLRLLFVGRLHRIKAIDNLLQAVTLLQQSGMKLSLTLAGSDWGEEQGLRSLAESLKLQSVRFLGHVEGDVLESAFANADVLVAPSHVENFGMAPAEALARGLPVIVSKGMPWSPVEENGCGLWVENSPHSLAEAIRRISGMDLPAMGARGRAWMAHDFAPESVGEQMRILYEELASGRDRRTITPAI